MYTVVCQQTIYRIGLQEKERCRRKSLILNAQTPCNTLTSSLYDLQPSIFLRNIIYTPLIYIFPRCPKCEFVSKPLKIKPRGKGNRSAHLADRWVSGMQWEGFNEVEYIQISLLCSFFSFKKCYYKTYSNTLSNCPVMATSFVFLFLP